MERIIELLNQNKKVSAWKLIQGETESCELFYVLKNLETNRASKTKEYSLTIYVDGEGTRGSANVNIYLTGFISTQEKSEIIISLKTNGCLMEILFCMVAP